MTFTRHKLAVDVTDMRVMENPYPLSDCVLCGEHITTTEIPMLVLPTTSFAREDVWSIAHQSCARKAKGIIDPN